MAHFPKPFFRESRQLWYVQIDGKQHNLGPEREAAFDRYHELMRKPQAVRATGDSAAIIMDAFLDWTQKHRAPRTYDWYLERIQSFLETVSIGMSVDQLKPFHLTQWTDGHLTWNGGMKRGAITAIQRAFNWALKQGLIERNPIAHVEKPPQGKREDIISESDYQKMLGLTRDEAFRDLLVISWETGTRPQESLRVHARHVDLANRRWVFPKSESKGKKRERVIYLTDSAMEITKRLMAMRPEGPLFLNSRGRAWTAFSVDCRFKRFAKKIGKKYCLYTCRHTWMTRLLKSGVDPITVSTLAGHADTSMLARVYAHLSHDPKHLQQALNRTRG